MEQLINYITSKISLSPEAKDYIYSISKKRIVEKGAVLIHEGQKVNKIFFVTEGCLSSYCTDEVGREHTLQFAIKNWWISDYIAIYNNERSQLTVESLKKSQVIEFSTQGLEDLLIKFPEFEVFQRNNLERHLVSLQKRILNQLQLSASERYDVFVQQYPDIELFTPNYHIASYLGITQESLSRIRVERAKK